MCVLVNVMKKGDDRMPQINPAKYYNNVHALRYDYVPVREVHTSGAITTSYDHITTPWKSVPTVSGNISSQSVILGYDLTITYTGAANIGNHVISTTRLPNYWNDVNVTQKTQAATGLTPYAITGCCCYVRPFSSSPLECIRCFSCLTCTWCCVVPCIDSHLNQKSHAFEKMRDEVAHESMSKAIADELQAADAIVDARIKEQQAKVNTQAVLPAGMVGISEAQLASLIQQAARGAQANVAQVPLAPAANNGANVVPITTQYQQHQNNGQRNQPMAALSVVTAPPPSLVASRI